MHVHHLYKILTTDLKPYYYFKFDEDTGDLAMNVLEFHRNGQISKQGVFPYNYFKSRDKKIATSNAYDKSFPFITKRKYRLLMKKLKELKQSVSNT